jgi:hypothetical protein
VIYIECHHCGQVNWVDEENEEPTCELCDNSLEDIEFDYEEEETEEEE